MRKSIIKHAIAVVCDELLSETYGMVYDSWYDSDTGETWNGPEVVKTRQTLFDYVENALQVLSASDFCRDKDETR